MGRLRRAWEALRGRNIYPSDIVRIQAEWVEYKLLFQDLLERQSAMLARQAKAEKARVARLQEDAPDRLTPPHTSAKAAVRAQAAAMRGLAAYQRQLELKPPPPEPEN